MTKGTSMKIIPALVFGLFSSYTSAAGFQLLEQNASGIGNAYAGSAAVADNASTIFYNPAGMTKLQDREISLGLVAIQPNFEFKDSGASRNPTAMGGGVPTGGNGGNAGGVWAPLPNGYLSWALSKDLYVGVGVGAPFGLKTEYTKGWAGQFQSNKFDIKTYNVNPSIAYRVNDVVSLGFGLDWQRIEAEYQKQSVVAAGVARATTVKLDNDAWSWNAGALFQISPSTRVGVSYRAAVQHDAKGTTDVAGVAKVNNSASVKLPDSAILSVQQVLNDRWEMLGDLSWTGWSSIQSLIINNPAPLTTDSLALKFRNTWRVALGANYNYTDAWKLKFGVAYDQSPVYQDQYRTASLPDGNRTWFSLGAQYKITPTAKVDVGYAYLWVKDQKVSNNGGNQTLKGLLDGTYSDSAHVFGAQYSQAF
jgi:long-chain fatty acid transport protein